MAEFSKFQALHDLSEFIGLETPALERAMEQIQSSSVPGSLSQVISSSDIENFARTAPNSSNFTKKYKEGEEKNIGELNGMVMFLRGLKEAPETLEYLQSKSAAMDSSSDLMGPHEFTSNLFSDIVDSTNVKLSSKDINRLKTRLLEGSQKVIANTSEMLDNTLRRDRVKEVNLPAIPDWLDGRPHMSLNFFRSQLDQDENLGPLGDLGVSTQEYQLIQDILHLMMGCRATYITTETSCTPFSPPTFFIDSSVETSLRTLAKRFLPLVQYYSQVIAFVEEYSKYKYGLVNHALVAAIRNLLKDYMLLVTQLETQLRKGAMTLTKLWFYVEKTLTMMEMLSCLVCSIVKSGCRGGAVLSLLHERTISLTGCGQLQEVMTFLAQAASVPFMKTLKLWIYRGIIKDPYFEFMVMDNVDMEGMEGFSITDNAIADDYWSKRYSLKETNVPIFLQPHSDMIIRTGKYLNVIRDSGVSVSYPEQEELSYSIRSESYEKTIEKAYSFASKRLLKLLMEEKDFMGRLRSIKHFFLLDQGDFVVQLLTLCETELSKNIDDVVPTRLLSLLELSLRMSAANDHVYKDDVGCTLMPYSLMNQMMKILSIETDDEREFRAPPERLHMTGLQGFSLTYEIAWPLSLIIDKRSLFCYQMIFRHLFYCKHVERLLCRVWVRSKKLKHQYDGFYGSAFSLRHRMLLFIENLEYYMNFEVIERNWQNFITRINKVENVDEVWSSHLEFLNGCLADCMLTTPELLRIVTKLTGICVDFANFFLQLESEDSIEDDGESVEETLARFDLEFTALLVTLIEKITDMGKENYSDALNHLLYRLDFNKYYSEKSETMAFSAI